MLIEFCLPVYNEEKILEANALKLLNYCQAKKFSFAWSIVFIVNGSTDNSLAICRKIHSAFPNFFKIFSISFF